MRSGYTAANPEQTIADSVGGPTPCPVCDAAMLPSFQDEEAVYKLCPHCRYLKPCIRDLNAFAVNVEIYRKRFDEQLQTAAVITDKVRKKYGRFLDEVEAYRKLGTFLDIGCGAGRLLAAAAERGWQGHGADPSMENLSADSPDGVEIQARLLHECGFANDSFDVVHANEVMEHVDEVKPLAEEMCRVLRPGGVIVLRTPNHRSWTARAVGTKWRHYGIAEIGHVGFFAPRTFRELFDRSGLELLEVRTHHFSLRDRWSDKAPVVGGICRFSYKAIGLLAAMTGHGERLMAWGRKPA